MAMSAEGIPLRRKLEAQKRTVLVEAIDVSIPALVEQNKDKATRVARSVLVDIQQGNNPDLETYFRDKIRALGIDLDEAA